MLLTSGIILAWSGAIVDIPEGFVICDGNNSTPDLRNRFLIGAGATYDPGDVGGSAEHGHTGTTDGHDHDLPAGTDIAAGSDIKAIFSSDVDTFTTDEDSNLPPYYALAFIMKT